MVEQKKPEHWTDLASELGVSPPPPAEEKDQPRAEQDRQDQTAAAGHPTAAQREPHPRRQQPKVQRPATDWSQLAATLGVAGGAGPGESAIPEDRTPARPERADDALDSDEAASRAAHPPFDTAAAEREPVEAFVTVAEPASVLADDEIKFTDDRSETISDILEEAVDAATGEEVLLDAETADTGPADALPAEADKKPAKKRRKRRRRSRKLGGADAAQPTAEAAERENEEVPDDSGVSELAAGDQATVAPSGEAAAAGEVEEPGKSKRRRRRTSSHKKGATKQEADAEARSVSAGASDQRQHGAPPTCAESDPTSSQEATRRKDSSHEGETPAPGTTNKSSHRGIPSWEEAVDIVISANLQARAKHPSGKSSSRSRGSRGRGNRDKSSDQSS